MAGKSKQAKIDELGESIYSNFCEGGGFSDNAFQEAWSHYQSEHGDIENGSTAETLVIEAIKYAITDCVNQGFTI